MSRARILSLMEDTQALRRAGYLSSIVWCGDQRFIPDGGASRRNATHWVFSAVWIASIDPMPQPWMTRHEGQLPGGLRIH